jgi:hypothetical protein
MRAAVITIERNALKVRFANLNVGLRAFTHTLHIRLNSTVVKKALVNNFFGSLYLEFKESTNVQTALSIDKSKSVTILHD